MTATTATLFPQILDAIKTNHLTLIASLLGYLIASPDSLRLWLAAQKTGTLKARKDPVSLREAALSFLGVLCVQGLIVWTCNYADRETQSAAKMYLGVLLYVGNTFAFLKKHTAIKDMKWSVHRDAAGDIVPKLVSLKSSKKPTKTLIVLFLGTVVLTAAAYVAESYISVLIISTAFVCNMSSLTRMNISMRALILAFLGTISAILALFFGVALYLHFYPEAPLDPSPSGPIETLRIQKQWIFASLLAFIPGYLITTALRLDYQRHLNSYPESNEFSFHTVLAPEPKEGHRQELGDGVLIPEENLPAFSKVYYATTLLTWSFVWITFICISPFLPFEKPLTAMQFSSIVLFIELPIMCFSLMAVAAVRGEWSLLWSYSEVWVVKASDKEIAEYHGPWVQSNLEEIKKKRGVQCDLEVSTKEKVQDQTDTSHKV
ncbi:hypothetical protein K439DRAFT_1659431 [Ramaria rubella]|nr:hypothetical protein K439DRAFT_1659431 [Ramaria rubella]